MAIASLVLGIISLLFDWIPFVGVYIGIVAGLIAIVLGIIKLVKLKKEEVKTGKGMSIAGLITGAIGLLTSIVLLVFSLFVYNAAKNGLEEAFSSLNDSYYSDSIFTTEDESNSDFTFTTDNQSNNNSDNVKKNYLFGEVATVEKLKVNVKNVSDYVPADTYYTPKEGYKYIKVEVVLENEGENSKYISSYDFSCYADDFIMDEAYCYAGDEFSGADLAAGKKTSGSLYYEVPQAAKEIEIHFSYYIEDTYENNSIIFSNQ